MISQGHGLALTRNDNAALATRGLSASARVLEITRAEGGLPSLRGAGSSISNTKSVYGLVEYSRRITQVSAGSSRDSINAILKQG